MTRSEPRRLRTSSIDFAAGRFATTRWTLIRQAGSFDPDEARSALAELCTAYWYPLYVYRRRKGDDHAAATDSVQGFILSLLDRSRLGPQRETDARFRSYLLRAFANFQIDRHRQDATLRRGGDVSTASLDALCDFEDGARRYEVEASDERTPEELFERRYAQTLLERAFRQVEAEDERRGRLETFRALRPLVPPGSSGTDAAAARLGLSEGAVRVALHRLRGRLREALRSEIAETVGPDVDVDEEIGWLFGVLG